MATAEPTGTGRSSLRSWLGRHGQFLAIWPALAVLLIVSPLLAPGSLSQGSILTVLAFAGILAIASAGQTMVIQQGGLDLSVPGAISVSAVIVTKYPAGDDGQLLLWVVVALVVGGLVGLLAGVVITWFQVTPLVATLGVNALLYALVLQMTQGSSALTVPPALAAFSVGRTFGVPNVAIVAAVLLVCVECAIVFSTIGRRFVAVGTNPRAARAAGMRVTRYRAGTYVAAGIAYAAAGILLAGYLGTPNLFVGSNYLLPTVAAVVLGGTSLLGGAGSVVATAGGALFLVQLQQVTQGMGASAAVQNIITALIIVIGMAARVVPNRWRAWSRHRAEFRTHGREVQVSGH